MKKILLSFGFVAMISASTIASVYEDKTADIDDLRTQGYSEATLQIVDWARYRNGDMNHKYIRYYKEKEAKDKLRLGRAYQRIKIYTDPIQDDGHFGDHHIEFSNTWMGDEVQYASDKVPNKQIENL